MPPSAAVCDISSAEIDVKTCHFALACITLSGLVATAFADDAQPLSKEELQQLIPGSHASNTRSDGYLQRWTNDPSGKLIVSVISPPGQQHTSQTAQGTWRISDDGQYCVQIQWRMQPVSWCAAVQKAADGKFSLVGDGSPSLPRHLEISK